MKVGSIAELSSEFQEDRIIWVDDDDVVDKVCVHWPPLYTQWIGELFKSISDYFSK